LTNHTKNDIKQWKWTFLAFRSDLDRRYLDEWTDGLSIKALNEFQAVIEILSVSPISAWRRPQFDRLSGKRYAGMGEMRFKIAKDQYRVFGYFGPQRLQFTLLHACMKQRSELKAEMDLALARKKLVELDNRRTYVFTFSR
jgi:hypothetical protein